MEYLIYTVERQGQKLDNAHEYESDFGVLKWPSAIIGEHNDLGTVG